MTATLCKMMWYKCCLLLIIVSAANANIGGIEHTFLPDPSGIAVFKNDEACLTIDTKTSIEQLYGCSVSNWTFDASSMFHTRSACESIEMLSKIRSNHHEMYEHAIILKSGPISELVLKFRVNSEDGNGIEISSKCGKFFYKSLSVMDSYGNSVESAMLWEESSNSIVLTVKGHGPLMYPLVIDPLASTAFWSFDGSDVDAAFGHAIAIGDFNGDTYPDVAISDPLYSTSTYAFTGCVRVWKNVGGNSFELYRTLTRAVTGGQDANFGFSLSAGKLASASWDYLYVGAPRFGTIAPDICGSVERNFMRGSGFRYTGSTSGLGNTPSATYAPSSTPGTTDRRWAGTSVKISRLVSDLVGQTGWIYDSNQWAPEGYVQTMTSGTTTETKNGRYMNPLSSPATSVAYRNSTYANDAHFGFAIETAALDGDTLQDSLVSAPRMSRSGNYLTFTGAVFVYLGRHKAHASFYSSTYGVQPSFVIWGDQHGSNFGKLILNLGDTDGDGRENVLISAPNYNDDRGRVYIYNGVQNTLNTPFTSTAVDLANPVILEGSTVGELFGWSAAVMKESDNKKNLIIGSPLYGADQRGKVSIFEQLANGSYSKTPTYTYEGTPGSRFGWTVASADFNKDTYADVLVTSESFKNGLGQRVGRSELFLGMKLSDYSITTSVTPSGNVVQGIATYSYIIVDFVNKGPAPDAASQLIVQMSQALPVVSLSWNGTTCNTVGQVITCTANAVVNRNFRLNLTLGISDASLGDYMFQISATGANYDKTPASVVSGFSLISQADIALACSANGTNFMAGHAVRYTCVVTNTAGPSPALGVVLTTTVNSSLTLVSTPDGCVGGLVCSLGTIPVGGQATVVMDARVRTSTSSPNVYMMFNASTGSVDLQSDNNIDSEIVQVTLSADVSTSVTTTSPAAYSGEVLYYTITTANGGPSDAVDVDVVISWGSEYVVKSDGLSYANSSCIVGANSASCFIPRIASGGRNEFTLSGSVTAGALGPQMTVSVTSVHPTSDPVPTNNNKTHTLEVTRRSNILGYLFGYPSPINRETVVNYTVSLMNKGPADALDVIVNVELPVPNTYDVTWGMVGGRTLVGTHNVTQYVGSLLANAVHNFWFSFEVPVTMPTPMLARIIVDGNFYTAFSQALSSSVSIPVRTGSNLQGVLSLYPDPPVAGGAVTISFTLLNEGPSSSPNTIANISIPAPAYMVSRTTPPNWTCTNSSLQVLECAANEGINVQVGSVVTVSVVVRVPADMFGAMVLTGAGYGSELDIDVTDNSDVKVTTITESANLNVAMVLSPPIVSGGEELVSSVIYGNAGPGVAYNATMIYAIPSSLSYVSAVTSNGTCTAIPGGVNCSLADVIPSARGSIVIKFKISSTMASGSVYVLAHISSRATVDPPTDNVVNLTKTVSVLMADLAVVATCPTARYVGETFTLDTVIFNAGFASSVPCINVTYPALAKLQASNMECDTATPGLLICNASSALDASKSMTARFTFLSDNMTVGDHDMQFNVLGTVLDNVLTDNFKNCTVEFSVLRDVNLVVYIAATNVTYYGVATSYTIQVTNIGPGIAENVNVVIDVPDVSIASVLTLSLGDNCELISNKVECDFGVLQVNERSVSQIRLNITTEESCSYDVTATATTSCDELNPLDNNYTVSTNVPVETDVNVMLTSSISHAFFMDTISMRATIVNAGPSVANNVLFSLTYNDTLLTPLVTVGCDISVSGVVSCTIPKILPKKTSGQIVKFNVSSQEVGDAFFNASAIAPLSTDNSPDNNVANHTVTLGLESDLFLVTGCSQKVTHQNALVATYAFLRNNGPTRATDVYIVCSISSQARYVNITGVNASSCSVNDHEIVCNYPHVAKYEQMSLFFNALVDVGGVGDISIQCFANSSSIDSINNNNNNSALLVSIISDADVGVVVLANREIATIGTKIDYSVRITNNGSAIARQAVALISLSEQLVDITTSNPAACMVNSATNVINCTFPELFVGYDGLLVIKASVKNMTEFSGIIESNCSVSITSNNEDRNSTNNFSWAKVDLVIACDLEILVLVVPNPVPLGEYAYIYLKVLNKEVTPSTGTATFYIPSEIKVVKAPECVISQTTVDCLLKPVVKNSPQTFRIETLIHVTDASMLKLEAEVKPDLKDMVDENNYVSRNVSTNRNYEVSVAGSVSAGPYPRDSVQTWEARVSSRGPALVLYGALIVNFDNLDVISVPTGCSDYGTYYRCNVYNLTKNNDIRFQFKTQIGLLTSGDITMLLNLTETTHDGNILNNNLTLVRTVTDKADLKVEQTSINYESEVITREAFAIQSWITNGGPSVAINSSVVYHPSDGLILTPNSQNSSCVMSGADVVCVIPLLLKGSSSTVFLQGYIHEFRNTTLTITAVAGPVSPDDNTDENVKVIEIAPVVPSADVSMDILTRDTNGSLAMSFLVNSTCNMSVIVTNYGPSFAHELNVSVDLGVLSSHILNSTFTDPVTSCVLDNTTYTCFVSSLGVNRYTEIFVMISLKESGSHSLLYNLTHKYHETEQDNNNGNYTLRVLSPRVPAPLRTVKTEESAVVTEFIIGGGIAVFAAVVATSMGMFKRKRPGKPMELDQRLEEMEVTEAADAQLMEEYDELQAGDIKDVWTTGTTTTTSNK